MFGSFFMTVYIRVKTHPALDWRELDSIWYDIGKLPLFLLRTWMKISFVPHRVVVISE